MNKNELRAVMMKHGERMVDLAKHLGIATSSLSNKVNGLCNFKRDEIAEICNHYSLTSDELFNIFFDDAVNHQVTEKEKEVTA